MKIAILGGSFDPPHKGHIAIANRLLKLYKFDQIWLMPCLRHPFDKKLSSSKDRLEMTKFLENERIKISDLEINKKTTSYTIDTLECLSLKYPKHEFFWIVGTDQIKDFTKWKKWQEILDKFKTIVIPRSGFEGEQGLKKILTLTTLPKNIILVNKTIFPPIDISSTLIRNNLKEKKSISSFVPKKIEEYIIKNKLYQ
jgi:nicotinate-nucleotide adenylyltransferase